MHFDRLHRVLMARLGSVVTLADLAAMNAEAAQFIKREGSVRFLLDLSEGETVDIPLSQFVNLAQKAAVLPVEDRVYVASNPLFFGMCRMFAAHQANAGNRGPVVVGSMSEAYATLKLVDPDFRPLARSEAESGA
jgi:hypothetical protein